MCVSRCLKIAAVCLVLSAALPVCANDDEHHAVGNAASGKSDGHAEAGLPMDWKKDLALFSLVTFVVYAAVLKFGAWGPLRAGLSERERRIRQDIDDAESNRRKSEALLKDYTAQLAKVQDEVREVLAEARRDAEHAKLEIITAAQKEAESTKMRAIHEIERSRDQALSELFDFVSVNVVNATERMIGRSMSGSDHERLVSESLAELNIRRN